MSLSAMLIVKMAATYGGDMALSSFGIIQRILFFAMMLGMTIGGRGCSLSSALTTAPDAIIWRYGR
jgi:hypothetical protein